MDAMLKLAGDRPGKVAVAAAVAVWLSMGLASFAGYVPSAAYTASMGAAGLLYWTGHVRGWYDGERRPASWLVKVVLVSWSVTLVGGLADLILPLFR